MWPAPKACSGPVSGAACCCRCGRVHRLGRRVPFDSGDALAAVVVSFLLHLGVAPDIVREIAGHSDIEVTMTIYAHTSLDEKWAALGKLGEALG